MTKGVVEVYYDRDLRARFDQETGEQLALDDEEDAFDAALKAAMETE